MFCPSLPWRRLDRMDRNIGSQINLEDSFRHTDSSFMITCPRKPLSVKTTFAIFTCFLKICRVELYKKDNLVFALLCSCIPREIYTVPDSFYIMHAWQMTGIWHLFNFVFNRYMHHHLRWSRTVDCLQATKKEVMIQPLSHAWECNEKELVFGYAKADTLHFTMFLNK